MNEFVKNEVKVFGNTPTWYKHYNDMQDVFHIAELSSGFYIEKLISEKNYNRVSYLMFQDSMYRIMGKMMKGVKESLAFNYGKIENVEEVALEVALWGYIIRKLLFNYHICKNLGIKSKYSHEILDYLISYIFKETEDKECPSVPSEKTLIRLQPDLVHSGIVSNETIIDIQSKSGELSTVFNKIVAVPTASKGNDIYFINLFNILNSKEEVMSLMYEDLYNLSKETIFNIDIEVVDFTLYKVL